MIVIPAHDCQALETSLRQEWLDTNGLGGYASSTIHNCNTRKYHGLLVAGLEDPAGRFTLLSKMEDALLVEGCEHPLSCNSYPGTLHPAGYVSLQEFRLEEGPIFLYQAGQARIRKELLMVQGENTVLIRYEIEEAETPVTLRLNPLLAYRRHHELKREDAYLRATTTPVARGFSIQPYQGMPTLFIQANRDCTFVTNPDWYRNFEYFVEAERGYDCHEDCFCPGTLEIVLGRGEGVIVSASITEQSDLAGAWQREESGRQMHIRAADAVAQRSGSKDFAAPLSALIQSGRHFPFRTPGSGRASIIAGYPWFDDWGRDTLISLPGLTFYSGRPELGVEILKAVAPHEREGLIPNCFAADPRFHAYNSVDASLWYFWAVQQMLTCTGDRDTIHDQLWPVLKRIAGCFMTGTRHDIFMMPDGLLHAGNPHTQLTWMDATSHGNPVTPRHGFAVELNALWFNAICFCEQLASDFGEIAPWDPTLRSRLEHSFHRAFWNDNAGCLADTFVDGIRNESIRPNQIFAVSLPYSPLTQAQQKQVVDVVRRELFTPFGLRTLSPRDPAYRGRYEGDQPTRDAAYHQGTVWPWLLGHFGEAVLRTSDDPKAAARDLAARISPLLDYSLDGAGLCNVPEIWDGDPPHYPRGCPAQAWSSAELIRLFTLFGGTRSG